MNYDNIPLELKAYDQWVVWRFEDVKAAKPTKVPYSASNGRLADTTNSSTWSDFDQAKHALDSSKQYDGIGFVLSEKDPFTFIDLDDTKGDNEALEKQMKIYEAFDSFSERSPSGNGLHIIVKGSVPSGRKRSYVEVYSSVRYMTVTGDTFKKSPIKDYDQEVNILWEQMNEGRNATAFYAGLENAKSTDEEILKIAETAANADKFNTLYYDGDWQKHYPSQSEADFALFDIIAFYSENGAQTQRIFLNSKLGQREKSRAQYRINYMLNRCFDRMLPPIDIDGLRNKLNEILEKQAKKTIKPVETTQIKKPNDNIYSPPPGLIGDIAQFIYKQAPRPVPEISLAGAIGLISGIVGRAYNVSGTGLNQYTLLLAPTGTGKEAIAGGIDKLFNSVIKTVPAAVDFVGPGEIASSQAIIKYMSSGSVSFVSLVGEFGIYMQQMASTNAPPHLLGLRRFLLDAYNKSGNGKILRPLIYSDKDKNTNAVLAPAFSLLGESTPEKFYEGLHEGLISEGLLPRFTIIEYGGDRPPFNQNHIKAKPSADLIERLAALCAHALMLNSQNKTINVQFDVNSKKLFNDFDRHCDLQINTSDKEVRRHLWNRAHMKAMKLAGLVAVGLNPYNPLINVNIGSWAIEIVTNDARNFIQRFDAGEIGIDNDETKQLNKLVSTINDFVTLPWSDVGKYAKGMGQLHSERIIPYCYIQRRLAAIAVFRKDRLGSSLSIKKAINTLIERGDLQEVSRATLSKDFNLTAKSFMISNLNMLDDC